MREVTVTEKLISDATGYEITENSGWAIVRLRDGAECAHFQNLHELESYAPVLADRVFSRSKEIDTEKGAKP